MDLRSSWRHLAQHESVHARDHAKQLGRALMSALGAIRDARWQLKIGLEVAASLPGIVLRLALEPRLFDQLPYQACYPGVIVAAILGGLLPGAAAAAASAKDVDRLRRVFGFQPGTVLNPQAVTGIALPEDAPKVKAALDVAFDAAGDGLCHAKGRSAGSPPAARSFSRPAERFA